MTFATFANCADGLDAAQRGLGGAQGFEALASSQDLFQCRMVALEPVVLVLPINMPDALEMRVVADGLLL